MEISTQATLQVQVRDYSILRQNMQNSYLITELGLKKYGLKDARHFETNPELISEFLLKVNALC